ncbi:uncharacterized protein BO97DRAFT_459881 [Aspergillus homomorphus CBS 101889]|uniref:Uncharacterized protein n=1 Tax=Aspergillus homomorphus (strain CBS 101889) TaxID=1450537 RepID=A0A395HMB4_ASPHC|nr:hypothetical protein BO97DRAFT_459881 [Aspergillus homomorphus CBS 101889]RAL08900.1 hypothetical protein BO97DRAFT_459881 [Aspergillus homomorphus CBS 101889]
MLAMRFHSVGTAGSRFLQTNAIYVFRTTFDPSRLERAFYQLLFAWPDIRARINLQTDWRISDRRHGGTVAIASDRRALAECISLDQMAQEELDPVERARLGGDCSNPAAHLDSNSVPRFSSTCAAIRQVSTRIISAYASILHGESIEALEEQQPSRLVFQAPTQESNGPQSDDGLVSQLYQATRRQWLIGWLDHIIFFVPRSLRPMHIAGSAGGPSPYPCNPAKPQRDKTRPSLGYHSADETTQTIGFAYSFSRHLERPAALQNAMWVISIPLPTQTEHPVSIEAQLLALAVRVCQAVHAARSAANSSAGTTQPWARGTRSAPPSAALTPPIPSSFRPRNYIGRIWILVVKGVSSSPFYMTLGVGLVDVLRSIGLGYHDWILTTMDSVDHGYCL